MTSTTASHHTDYLVHSLGFTMNYARSLLKEVKEETFAHLPMPNFNHPAFVYGHLAVSGNFMLELLGRDDAKFSEMDAENAITWGFFRGFRSLFSIAYLGSNTR